MCLNRIAELKVMTIWIAQELPLFNFECLDILCAWIGPPSLKLWPIKISRELPLFNFVHLDILCAWIGPLCEKLWPFEFLESFRCSISSVSIYYAPESHLRVKSYDHLNFSRASVVQFWASRYIMGLNWTSELKVLSIWISHELPMLNFERLNIWRDSIRHPSKKLLSFENPQSFNIPFRVSRYIMGLNQTSE